jgi:PPOX class probable F420-dependent enzyme
MADAVQALKGEKYVCLETYRRDGTPVRVPVWVGELDGKLVVWTDPRSFKIKRLRNNPRARLAASSASGKPRGDWFDVTGEIVESKEGFERIDAVIAAKYGLQRWAIVQVYRLRGAWPGFCGVLFSPVNAATGVAAAEGLSTS